MTNKDLGDFEDKTFSYEFSVASNAEAEILNDKMDAFIVRQISYHGDLEVSKNYIVKDSGTIVAGIRSCFYLEKCVVITVLFVEEQHRHKGLGSLLLNKIETEAKAAGVSLIHLDTFDFQAKDFYLKNGYEIFAVLDNCPPGHKRYYMKKTLGGPEDKLNQRKITRTGVYGVVVDEGKLLVVRQKRGPYAGKFDFPGGGIEFGESAELALRREFSEEVGMEFDSIQLIDNLTATVDVHKTPSSEPYLFFQIGMIYRVNDCRWIKDEKQGDLHRIWIEPNGLSQEKCSSLLWQFVKNHLSDIIKENISIIPYDPNVHEEPAIRKLMSYSLYSAEEEKLNRILKAYSSKEQHLFLCFIDHKLIGLVGFDPGGTILHIAVDPAFRCRGIAREMICKNSKRFLEIKAEADKEGVGFYKACGFKVESLGEVYPRTERFKCTKQVGKSLRGEFCEFTD